MTARFPQVRRRPAVNSPVTAWDPHGVFLAALPFAVIGGVVLIDVLAGPGVGFVPMLSLCPALAAISRPPVPTALIGIVAGLCALAASVAALRNADLN